MDIREHSEYNSKHIESSVNIPLSQIDERINAVSRTKQVIIIDRENNQIGKIFAEHLENEGVDVKYLEKKPIWLGFRSNPITGMLCLPKLLTIPNACTWSPTTTTPISFFIFFSSHLTETIFLIEIPISL